MRQHFNPLVFLGSMIFLSNAFLAYGQSNVLGLPESTGKKTGTLVVAGGGRLPEEVYDEFIRLAGGKSGRVVHIPWAHPFSSMKSVRYAYNGWLEYDLRSFDFLAAATHQEADQDRLVAPLEKATGVWIGGGTQGRLANLYRGTKVEAALRRVLERGGIVGGTSAGASILSQTMIRYSESYDATVDEGFDLIHKAVIDQHFTQRGRHTRLVGVLDGHPGLVGLGVDEGTALFITGDRIRAIGRSQVAVFIPSQDRQPTLFYRLHDGDEATLAPAAKTGQLWLSFRESK